MPCSAALVFSREKGAFSECHHRPFEPGSITRREKRVLFRISGDFHPKNMATRYIAVNQLRQITAAESAPLRRETPVIRSERARHGKKEIRTPASIPHHPVTAGPQDRTDDRRDRSGQVGQRPKGDGPGGRSLRRVPFRRGSRPRRPRGTADPSPTRRRLRIGPLERPKTAQAVPSEGNGGSGRGCEASAAIGTFGFRCSEVVKSRAERRRRIVSHYPPKGRPSAFRPPFGGQARRDGN